MPCVAAPYPDFVVGLKNYRSGYRCTRHTVISTQATDDADVVDRARRDPCYAHFDFYFQKYNPRAEIKLEF